MGGHGLVIAWLIWCLLLTAIGVGGHMIIWGY